MAPSTTASVAAYAKDEKVLCFHHELLYEAKVLEVRRSDAKDKTSPHEYRIHYKGWKNTWDDWVPQDRLRKLTDDNKELAANLKRDLVQPQPSRASTKPASSSRRGKGQGSDPGSGRGSEERHSSVPAGGRGTKRGKDNDVEKVGAYYFLISCVPLSEFPQDPSSDSSVDRGCGADFSDIGDIIKSRSTDSSDDCSGDSCGKDSSEISRELGCSIHSADLSGDSQSGSSDPLDRGCNLYFSDPSDLDEYYSGQDHLNNENSIGNSYSEDDTSDKSTDGGCRLPTDYSSHSLDSSTEFLAMLPSRLKATTVGGRRINQGRKKSNHANPSRRSGRLLQQEVESDDAHSETAEDILARSPPPDKPEYISKTTEKMGMFWAPLISGPTQEEKDLMNQELAAVGKFQYPELYHPEYVKTRMNDPANLNRQLFFQGQDPATKLMIAGVPNTPPNLDPPGTGSPFDALKNPKSLVARLNRLPDEPDGMPYGWDDKALKTIPHSIISQLPPKTLASLPDSYRSTLPTKVLARDSEAPPARQILPTASRLTRQSQHTPVDDEDPPDVQDLLASERAKLLQQPASVYLPKYPGTGSTRHPFQPESPMRLTSTKTSAPKRRGKTAHACDNCRIKRAKCNGARPSCLSCDNFRIRCSFAGENRHESHEQPQALDEQLEGHLEEQPAAWPEEQQEQPEELRQPRSKEQRSTTVATNIDHSDMLMTNSQLGGLTLSTGVDSGLTADHSEAEDDGTDFNALHQRPFVPQLGITRELAGRFVNKSKKDHLDIPKTTSIPLIYHPKHVFSHLPNFPKPTRPRKPHAYSESTLQEETFLTRPSVRIVVPDHLKNLLVDDWENVTKSLLVVPLPSKAPVNFIIDSYFDEEKGKRRLGSAEADVLEEFVAGMKVYFDKAIGKTLLYKFERPQWAEIRQLWESGKYPEWEGKGPGDAYGAEHLCRMLVNMPEMIAQTNMDVQSVNRLREEISKLCSWLARNSGRFFCAKYEKPTAEYIEGAR